MFATILHPWGYPEWIGAALLVALLYFDWIRRILKRGDGSGI